METLSSILAWRIPWTEEPGGLPPMASQSRTRLSDYPERLRRASVPGGAVLHSSVARRDEVWLSPATGALPCGGTSTLPWPTPPCSAPGRTAALSRDGSKGLSTVPSQGAALHTTV